MSSTYTDRLGLELQANGENQNTWGDKANNVFSLIDEAVGGFVAVAITGDKTLTMDDGASSDARNAVIKLTGTPGAAFALTLPEVEKVWAIWNATDSAATIQTSTATATVSLPTGHRIILQSDGAGSVVRITPFVDSAGKVRGDADFSSLIADGAMVSGLVLPLTDGASGQFMRTDGEGNLSFGTPSGSGDVLAAANLSDLDDAEEARDNIGVAYASKGEAEAGTANDKTMTPLRTAQAIEALATSSVTLDVFTSSGTFTLAEDDIALMVEVISAGQGGEKARGNGNGGHGGLSGRSEILFIAADDVGATEDVIVGAGSLGDQEANTPAGGSSSFGGFLTVPGGGSNETSLFPSANAGNGANAFSEVEAKRGKVVRSLFGREFGGGGGGGGDSSDERPGAQGGSTTLGPGSGGDGGDGNIGERGGDGTAPGGGGGGGGSSSGYGGNGARGEVRVWRIKK